jgi:mRNA-degrading endonuclease RelE of RelBE toxin-antitoxin system
MKATFIELPPFERHRQNYLSDESFRELQKMLMKNPEAGDVIEGTGGLRKVRHADEKRGKGKRGGLRIIYYWWQIGKQCWLFSVYNKDEMDDLTAAQRKILKDLLKQELEARSTK